MCLPTGFQVHKVCVKGILELVGKYHSVVRICDNLFYLCLILFHNGFGTLLLEYTFWEIVINRGEENHKTVETQTILLW